MFKHVIVKAFFALGYTGTGLQATRSIAPYRMFDLDHFGAVDLD